jgi:hypothetical protein
LEFENRMAVSSLVKPSQPGDAMAELESASVVWKDEHLQYFQALMQ